MEKARHLQLDWGSATTKQRIPAFARMTDGKEYRQFERSREQLRNPFNLQFLTFHMIQLIIKINYSNFAFYSEFNKI